MTNASVLPVSCPRPRVRIIHETDPEKYFPAIMTLASDDVIELVGTHRYSVVKEWIRAGIRSRTPIRARTKNALSDLALRLRLPFVHDEVIVLGFAPWDWRGLLYFPLARRNRIVYHTSWPSWGLDDVPRTYGVCNRVFRDVWRSFLNRPNVTVVAVTDAVGDAVASTMGVGATVIPHAVPDLFYEMAERTRDSEVLRLLYVGELSDKKGIRQLLDIVRSLDGRPVELTLVGDGELRELCAEAGRARSNVRFLGPIRDRRRLAEEMGRHHVLMLLSQKRGGWEELFGIVLVEAMAAGLGVIATRHVGPLSILGAESDWLFDEDDLDEITSRLLALTEDLAPLVLARRDGVARARAFSVESVKADWAKVLTPADDAVGRAG